MYLPCTAEEIKRLGWDAPDIILVSGDTYLDTPFSGVALIGHVLMKAGFRTAIIAQPSLTTTDDIKRLGEPHLFWGVSSGCVDSMVANFTAMGKRRRQDDFTPGGENNARPDRAVIAYCNLIRSAFKPCKPLVIGGIEASLRRIAHYDFWSDSVRRPILFDAKADILVYGMAERTIVELATRLREKRDWHDIRGLCYAAPVSSLNSKEYIPLPSYSEVSAKTDAGHRQFLAMFKLFSANQDAHTAKTLFQPVDTRALIQNPPALPLTQSELDAVYELPYELDTHPFYAAKGAVRAWDTIRFSMTTHRGCYGECNFCAIAAHQGRTVVSRSERSLIAEAKRFLQHPKFKGIISDVGGPTANMYGFECEKKLRDGACPNKRCLTPTCCSGMKPDHRPQLRLLRALRALPGIRHVFVASGIRPDLVFADQQQGETYIEELAAHHVSGQLKLAPEHVTQHILEFMGKPDIDSVLHFKERFEAANRKAGKRQFLTYYFIAAHPGCIDDDMRQLKKFARSKLFLIPEQVQVFTPTPSTWSTAMYYTGINPASNKQIPVARTFRERHEQKEILVSK
jgi:uncharacterized radical SAM protein YgiQ